MASGFQIPEARKAAATEYLAALEDFTTKWMALDDFARIQEDLEQVLILYTLQGYKRAFIGRMARSLQVGTGIALALFLVA